MAKCYIITTISDVLQQHEGMRTAADIMMSLEEIFAMRSKATKRDVVTTFMNLRMKLGQAVKDHIVKFKLDYTLNNKEYTLQSLMQNVQSAEKILVKGKGQEIHVVGKVTTVKTCKKVKKTQKKKKLGPTKKETKKVIKIKEKCFICGENGH
ncbi:hypothetical protein ACOSP7_022490 [Xanthoceras sorbifolium]